LENLQAHNAGQPGRVYDLSLSIGIARYAPVHPCSLAELLDRGDKEMYKEKQKKTTGRDK
ncbi:MAG: hypothetical protein WC291_11460, partial [Thermodesulfovibrionales bacterium]